MTNQKNNFNKILLFLLLPLTIFLYTCDKAPVMPDPDPNRPTASFQFEVIDTFNVNFADFSSNAEIYDWDFGDGNTSTEANPSHRYQDEGTYSVTLTITSISDLVASTNQVVEIKIPTGGGSNPTVGTLLEKLAGTTAEGKTWILRREAGSPAFGVGPEPGDVQWYALGINDALDTSPCTMDDEYTFKPDGTFSFQSHGTFTLDEEQFGGWNDNFSGGCNYESTPGIFTSSGGQDLTAFRNGGDYTFELMDEEMTIIGEGAYIGNAAKQNAGDLGPNAALPAQIQYTIDNIIDGPTVDSMRLVMTTGGGGAFWTFWMVHYDDESLRPPLPGAAVYEPSVLSNDTGKTWKLAGIGAYKVGPERGSGEWWPGVDEAGVLERACQFDDEFTFFNDGTFTYDAFGMTFAEDYIPGGNFTCQDPATFPAPFDALGSSNNHSFTVEAGTGSDLGTVTVSGTGAFIGWSKGHNNGEYANTDTELQNEITYNILDYSTMGSKSQIVIAVDFCFGGCFWTITLETEN